MLLEIFIKLKLNKITMNKRNVTLKDIAKECNCSVATVSYVLNNVSNQSISEERRNKILQVANLYQYGANPFAKALANGNVHNILIYFDEPSSLLIKAEILDFIQDLATFLKKEDFLLMVAPSKELVRYDFVDAVIVYRSNKETFRKLANINFIPLIAVDLIIDEPLFFEVNNDLLTLLSKYRNNSNYHIISLPYGDELINNSLKSLSNFTFISSLNEINSFKDKFKSSSIQVIALNRELYLSLKEDISNIKLIDLTTERKFEAILESINLALSRELVANHKMIINSGE